MKNLKGRVIHGSGDGKKIGFPTANIYPTEEIGIETGVYACRIIFENSQYKAIAHFGPRKIFDETKNQLEVHIFDFVGDIYEKEVEIEFVKYIRQTMRFESMQDMLAQIERDIVIAKEILSPHTASQD